MRFLKLFVLLALVSPAFGQGAAATGSPVVVNGSGLPLAGTMVAVCNTNPGINPPALCSGRNLATLYTDITLSTTCTGTLKALSNQANPRTGSGCSNPGLTDGLGNVYAFSNAGTYWCEYKGGNILGIAVAVCLFPNSGIGNAPAGVAASSALVSSAVGQLAVYQTKPALDVRDFGVACSSSVDNTAAFQSALTAVCPSGGRGKALILPNSCPIVVSSTIVAAKCAGMSIDTPSPQGQASIGNAELLWYGPAGGTVLELNQVRDSNLGHLTIDTEASNHGAVGANIGLLVDEIAPVTNIVTNNHFDNIQIYNPTANPNFIGINVCPTAPGNCEAQNFDRLFLTCSGQNPPTATSAGAGLEFSAGEPYYHYIHWHESNGCSNGLILGSQVVDVDGGLTEANYTDIQINPGQAITVRNVRSEGSVAPIVIVGSPTDVRIQDNVFAAGANGGTTIGYSGNLGGARIHLSHNSWDGNNTVTPFGPIGAGNFAGSFFSEGNSYPGTICPVVTTANFWESLGDNCANPPFNGPFQMGGGEGLANVPSGQLINYHNGFRSVPQTVSKTFKCSAAFEGSIQAIKDSTTNTLGATISGGGSFHVLGYCDGTNFVVLAP